MTPTTATIIEAAILVFICTVSILGNISLFFVFTRRKNLRTISNGFLLNLAFADLLVSVLNMPITVVTIIRQRWIFGDSACVLLGFTTMLSFVSSVMSLAMIAINRYYYVVQWKTYPFIFTPRRSVLFAGAVWLISLLLSSPPLFGWAEYRYITGKSYCFVFWPSDVYYMYFMLTICFFGPLTVMFLSYFNILRFTREAKRRVDQHKDIVIRQQEMKTRQESESYFFERNKRRFRMTQEEAKITNTLLIVVACFMACWAPFAMTMFFDVYYAHSLPRILDISTLLLGYANSMCNPIVYGVRNQAVRSELVRLVTHFHCPRFNTSRVSVLNTFHASSVMACQMTAAQAPDKLQVSRLLIAESASDETNTLHSSKPALRSTDNTQIDQDTMNLSSSNRFIRHQRSV